MTVALADTAFVPRPIAATPPPPPPRVSRFPDPIKPLWTGFQYKTHQISGIHWLLKREEKELGGLICDEMGLGKTIQLMALVKASAPRSNSLLIAPVAVLQQWADIAAKSNITVLRPGIKGWETQGTYRLNAPKLHIIGYEMARNKPSLLMNIAWDRLICDEAHRLGSGGSLFKMVERLPAAIKWLLTATPIVNGMKDFENLLRLCGTPSKSFGSFETLKPVIKETVLARTMEQLRSAIPDAPPKPELQTIDLPFQTEEEGEFYRGMAGVIVKRWKALDSDGGSALAKLQLFVRLRQLSLHPQVYISARRKALGAFYARPDWTGSSTKFETIKELVNAADTKPHKWIVFCHFISEMEMLKQMLKAEPTVRNVHMYNGSLSTEERKRVLEETLDPVPTGKADVLLIQLQSGGVGLNLQHFDRIIFSGPWWTSALMEQAIGRAVRIGQREVVKVYHLRLEEEEAINIDSVMMEKAAAKGDLCRAVLECAENVC
jgi:SNF2 family DNA or RNA helicase